MRSRADCPDWAAPLLEEAFGDDWVGEASALAARPPLDLRANTLKATRQKVIAELDGTGAEATRLATHGIRIPPIDGAGRHPNVQAEPAFQKGWFEVQDEGSQVAAELAGATPGMQVLDFCAGAGGKTLALSAAMENHGQIFAYDSDKSRLAPIFDRIRRSENRNVQVVSQARRTGRAGRRSMDLVAGRCAVHRLRHVAPPPRRQMAADADASSTRGSPSRRRSSTRPARFVKPGGRLVYITCSVFRRGKPAADRSVPAAQPGFRPGGSRRLVRDAFSGQVGTGALRRRMPA